jgi:hypothetical protein
MGLIQMFCIDDSNRPEDIPLTHWIEEGELYTLKDVKRLKMQGGRLGIQIHEINLLELCGQHEFFSLDRFAIDVDEVEAFKQVIIASGRQDSISSYDLNKLFND